MRRFAAGVTVLLFILCIFLNTPCSFALKQEDIAVQKDTSWFDYSAPKKKYFINNEAELLGFASLVNEYQQDNWKPSRFERFEGVTFILTADIELTQPWIPVGTGTSTYFAGVFDGNNHIISNLNINNSTANTGFFGCLYGEVKNLTIKGRISSEDKNCGGIAGMLASEAKITNCTSDINISACEKTGGIAGYNDCGTITSCTSNGTVSGTYKTGGIVGENWGGTISGCINTGDVISSLKGIETYGTGGIAGKSVSNTASITQCCNLGRIFSATEATGGIAGYINAGGSTIKNCFNLADITIRQPSKEAQNTVSYAGGIAGIAAERNVIINSCWNFAKCINADIAGGIIGRYLNENNNEHTLKIYNNYYIHKYFDSGIGFSENPDDSQLKNTAIGLSANMMINKLKYSPVYNNCILQYNTDLRYISHNALQLYIKNIQIKKKTERYK